MAVVRLLGPLFLILIDKKITATGVRILKPPVRQIGPLGFPRLTQIPYFVYFGLTPPYVVN